MQKYLITIKQLLLQCICILVMIVPVFGQTYLSNMSGTYTNGGYYHNTSVTISSNTTISPGAGQAVRVYISGQDCLPITTVPTAGQNYILTTTPRIVGYNPASAGYTTCDVMQNIQYIDGLGRPLQSVEVLGNPTATKDVVQPFSYDALGRESQKYLAYTQSTATPGGYRPNATLSEQQTFYSQTGQNYKDIPTPYSITVFEPSALNRKVEQGAPGNAWQPGQHTTGMAYTSNDANTVNFSTGTGFPARLYAVNIDVNGVRTLVTSGNYVAGMLYVTISHDENYTGSGKAGTVEEYKDKDNHVVLKRTFNINLSNPASPVQEILSTYYVYDDFGQLCYTLTPGASADGGISSANNPATLNDLCYQYIYDLKNRLTQKKIPGKDWEYIVYNKLDQAVATQDAVQRGKSPQQWTFTKYDGLGRVAQTGIYEYGNTAGTNYYNDIKTQAESPQTIWETATGNGTNAGYTNVSFPTTSTQLLTVNYYDKYSNAPGLPAHYSSPATAITNPDALPVANKVAILKSDGSVSTDMLWSVQYYDDDKHNIKSYQQHYLKGPGNYSTYNYDEVTNAYDFTDAVTNSTRLHYKNNNNSAVQALKTESAYAYDHTGRKIETRQRINTDPEILLSKTEFNEIGQVLTKRLHSTNGAAYLQSITYAYNERGWMLMANTNDNLFNLELKYESPSVGKQYNGNISQAVYNVTKATNPGSRTFTYTYDELNRLTGAASTGNMLDETINYDLMGNITKMQRGGMGTLNYTNYTGNQLNTVTGYSPRSYLYDANGNATSDGNGVSIDYNMLNLPRAVSSTLATYTYDATGKKLRNTGTDGTWDYINGIVYHNDNIYFLNTEEGRAVSNSGIYNYEYYLKDHLGDNRVSIDNYNNTARVVQEDEYYSFGLLKPGGYRFGPDNRYLYNGKEVQTDLANQYDYGARFYDPVIGRFTTLDPSADDEDQEIGTPYGYVANNPIVKNDPDGKIWNFVIGAALGAVVEVGTQMISNHLEHKPLTDINWKAVGVSAVEGAVTSGTSVGEKFLVKGGFALVKAGIDYSKDHDIKSLKDVGNIAKNAAIDMAVDAGGKVVGKLGKAVAGGKIVGAVEKFAEKAGTSRSKVARTLMGAGVNSRVSGAIAKDIRDGQKVLVKGIKESINTAASSTAKATTNQTVTGIKDNTRLK
jgi:RHS repeat-associated protein